MNRTEINAGLVDAFRNDPSIIAELIEDPINGDFKTEISVTDEFLIDVLYTDKIIVLQSGDGIADHIWVSREDRLLETLVDRIKLMIRVLTVFKAVTSSLEPVA